MKKLLSAILILTASSQVAHASVPCADAGPQTPRDITSAAGKNTLDFPYAPHSTKMNLCNLHTHTNAEHKGPDFHIKVGDGKYGGYACNETPSLTKEQRADPFDGKGAYGKVKPGDTIEVHWVHSSCDIEPGEGLGSCLSDTCDDVRLRVEAQVFLVVNDPYALDFRDYILSKKKRNGFYQAKSIPMDTGKPVVFRGSTTGSVYNQETCSPAHVTWSVRPQCAKLNIASLHQWAEDGNVFKEDYSHGVRQLVTDPGLLAPIEKK